MNTYISKLAQRFNSEVKKLIYEKMLNEYMNTNILKLKPRLNSEVSDFWMLKA